jgi:hypothetical protein
MSDGIAGLDLAFVTALSLFAELALFSVLYLRQGKPSKEQEPRMRNSKGEAGS